MTSISLTAALISHSASAWMTDSDRPHFVLPGNPTSRQFPIQFKVAIIVCRSIENFDQHMSIHRMSPHDTGLQIKAGKSRMMQTGAVNINIPVSGFVADRAAFQTWPGRNRSRCRLLIRFCVLPESVLPESVHRDVHRYRSSYDLLPLDNFFDRNRKHYRGCLSVVPY